MTEFKKGDKVEARIDSDEVGEAPWIWMKGVIVDRVLSSYMVKLNRDRGRFAFVQHEDLRHVEDW